jgi:hypothetical protein
VLQVGHSLGKSPQVSQVAGSSSREAFGKDLGTERPGEWDPAGMGLH